MNRLPESSWGKIGATHLVVERQPLVLECGKLKLDEPREKRVLRQIAGTGFITNCQVGDLGILPLGLGLRGTEPKASA